MGHNLKPAGPSKPGRGRKVVVAMSGGVDSSVAAALLKDEGFELVGVFMRNGAVADIEDDGHACSNAPAVEPGEAGHTLSLPQRRSHKQGCCSVNDAHDARLVAAMLDIPFYVLNFEKDFERIQRYFVAEYNVGRTPNPCVRCNDWLKFGKLHAYARSIDADFVASGHYARVIPGDRPRLLRGLDHAKDQSYVLFGSRPEQLNHMLLPVGGYRKDQIRAMAQELKLPTFNKPDSQEICFVPDNDYAAFVERRTAEGFAQGPILDKQGNVIGRHEGHQHFTHGQRRGIGVALGYPIYVIGKDPAANTITIGSKDDLLSIGCVASQANWLIPPRGTDDLPIGGDGWIECLVKVRYNSPPAPGRFRAFGHGSGRGDGEGELQHPDIEVAFDQPMEAVTPGQAVVCYGRPDTPWADTVLAGGWIDATTRPGDVS